MTQKVYVIERLPIEMELSDGDRAALYGWPEVNIEESDDDRQED